MIGKPFDWAASQMPLNVMDASYRSFQKQVLPVMLQKGIGAIGMKSLGGNGSIVAKAGVPIDQALGYVFSLPISTLVSGIDSEKVLDQNLKVVRNFTPMSEDERPRPRSQVPQGGGGRPVRAVQVVKDVRRSGPPEAARLRPGGGHLTIGRGFFRRPSVNYSPRESNRSAGSFDLTRVSKST